MQILLTNDDGIHAPVLKIFAEQLSQLGDVTVIAPATEQSGVSHCLTYRTPLQTETVSWDNGIPAWGVHGTPADCVRLGTLNLCKVKPDLVVSGINHGLNSGVNVIYSGTLAGAEEGVMLAIDSIALSLEYAATPPWNAAVEISCHLIKKILANQVDKDPILYNINIPLSACALTPNPPVMVASADMTPNLQKYDQHLNPFGRPYYWYPFVKPNDVTDENIDSKEITDRVALKKGFVTITPLDYTRTKFSALESLQQSLSGQSKTEKNPQHVRQDQNLFIDGT